MWGERALDAVQSVLWHGESAVTDVDTAAWVNGDVGRALAVALAEASNADVAAVPTAARIVLQNDVWGLWQRLQKLDSSEQQHALSTAAAALVRHLAVDGVDEAGPGFPPDVARVLGAAFTEQESELASLQHERLFGLRRLFRVAVAEREPQIPSAHAVERAFFSTLVALDTHLKPRRTTITGDLEMLRFDGDSLVAARVFELDRRGVRCGEPSLHEVDVVTRVPGLSANAYFVRFAAGVPLKDLPCAQCHDDAASMSVPNPRLVVGARQQPLLMDIAAEAAGLGPTL